MRRGLPTGGGGCTAGQRRARGNWEAKRYREAGEIEGEDGAVPAEGMRKSMRGQGRASARRKGQGDD